MPHIECVKNNGKPYLRLAESRYVKDIGRQKKFVIKNLGPLSKFDDGKPDFLKRFRENALVGTNTTRGTAENDDIYFQHTEARNIYYNKAIENTIFFIKTSKFL